MTLLNSVCGLHEVTSEIGLGVLLRLPQGRVFLGSDLERLRRQLINYRVDSLRLLEHLLRVCRQLMIERVGRLEILGRNILVLSYLKEKNRDEDNWYKES